ncbi:hypothetical protein [Streptomyces sp. NPDC097619]|uniref:hypothetical protein n=1 Tax=Streptomyces sp. NPDC097619 TaxID=3157228 RepID=UPI00331825E7
MPRVVVVSPPFRSHAAPLSVLAGALRERGADVVFACTEAFEDLAVGAGLRFVRLAVTRKANTGVAETTAQDPTEAGRLTEFLDATRQGSIAALATQARHRRADMLAEPEAVLARLRALDEHTRPDWYVVDQLAYCATLALHCLRARYATYCPGHPTYVPGAPTSSSVSLTTGRRRCAPILRSCPGSKTPHGTTTAPSPPCSSRSGSALLPGPRVRASRSR